MGLNAALDVAGHVPEAPTGEEGSEGGGGILGGIAGLLKGLFGGGDSGGGSGLGGTLGQVLGPIAMGLIAQQMNKGSQGKAHWLTGLHFGGAKPGQGAGDIMMQNYMALRQQKQLDAMKAQQAMAELKMKNELELQKEERKFQMDLAKSIAEDNPDVYKNQAFVDMLKTGDYSKLAEIAPDIAPNLDAMRAKTTAELIKEIEADPTAITRLNRSERSLLAAAKYMPEGLTDAEMLNHKMQMIKLDAQQNMQMNQINAANYRNERNIAARFGAQEQAAANAMALAAYNKGVLSADQIADNEREDRKFETTRDKVEFEKKIAEEKLGIEKQKLEQNGKKSGNGGTGPRKVTLNMSQNIDSTGNLPPPGNTETTFTVVDMGDTEIHYPDKGNYVAVYQKNDDGPSVIPTIYPRIIWDNKMSKQGLPAGERDWQGVVGAATGGAGFGDYGSGNTSDAGPSEEDTAFDDAFNAMWESEE
jgi:hypothetical protein